MSKASKMSDHELGQALSIIDGTTQTYIEEATAVRALFAEESPQQDELAQLRADITRTAAVVQAIDVMDVDAHTSGARDKQGARLLRLLARERERMSNKENG